MNRIDGLNGFGLASTFDLAGDLRRTRGRDVAGTLTQDRVEISDVARFLQSASILPSDRLKKVARIREEIASGAYETPEKLDVALDRLFADINE